MNTKYCRVLLKISGEFLMGDHDFGLDVETINRIAGEVAEVHNAGCKICIVMGGGNVFRGALAASYGMHRVVADNIGMLATVMNSVAFQNSLEKFGVQTRVMSAIAMPTICEPYIRRKALRHLEKGRLVICAAGSGNPYFTTDTAAALRALETDCEVFMKATKVAGIYTADPTRDKDAQFIEKMSYKEAIDLDIRIMDHTAITLAKENNMPVVIFSIRENGNFKKVLTGGGCCSVIS
jgi:uridylate kinase